MLEHNCQFGCPAFKKLEIDHFHYTAALKLIREQTKMGSFTANGIEALINSVLGDK